MSTSMGMNELPARIWLIKAEQALAKAAEQLPPPQREQINMARGIIDGLFAEASGIDPWMQTK